MSSYCIYGYDILFAMHHLKLSDERESDEFFASIIITYYRKKGLGVIKCSKNALAGIRMVVPYLFNVVLETFQLEAYT